MTDTPQRPHLTLPAPAPAQGSFAPGYDAVAERFARQLAGGEEIGAALCIHHRGACVVDLWGGVADVATQRPWTADTRVLVFSVTKGLTAMAFHLLADRGRIDWQAPVADYWPGFGAAGKATIRVGTLLDHRAGLPGLATRLTLADCLDPARTDTVRSALERQTPVWEPGTAQGYHATTFGLYARELFERIAGESLGGFLLRELFAPLGSDARLGTPASEDGRTAAIVPPSNAARVGHMLAAAITRPWSAEGRLARAMLAPRSVPRAALLNPDPGAEGVAAYDRPTARRTELAWASATASAAGISRAYLPFASGGVHAGRRYLSPETLVPVYERQSWSPCDAVLQKPLGWSHGFLKDEPHVFSPTRAAFGHAGLGGALGWCDPEHELAIGYVMNRLDWRVRSPRPVALCRALYACEAVRNGPVTKAGAP